MKNMTLDEHRAAGVALASILSECASADRLTSQSIRKIERTLNSLRSRLEDLSLRDYGDAAWPSLYYVNPPPRENVELNVLLTRLREVNAIINGKVPARVIDIYLRADRKLLLLAKNDHVYDLKRGAA
jgi:hypothetical protein